MSRLAARGFMITAGVVLFLIAFGTYFNAGPYIPYHEQLSSVKNELLEGAIGHKPAQAPAPSFVPSAGTTPSDPVVYTKPKKSEEEKTAEKEEKERKEQEKKEKEQKEQEKKEKEQKEQEKKEKKKGTARYKNQQTFDAPEPLTFSPSGPAASQVAILTASDGKGHNGGIKDLLTQALANRQAYADYHGYINNYVNISKFDIGTAHPVWAKLPAIIETFNTYPDVQWVWCLDADAIIMSPSVKLHEAILGPASLSNLLQRDVMMNKPKERELKTDKDPNVQNIDMVITQDQNGLNAGSFLIRRSQFTKTLLDVWGEPLFMEADWPGLEQDALLHLWVEHPVIRSHIGLIPQHYINAYATQHESDMSFRKGDLCLHFAGCWVGNVCQSNWDKYWAMRESLPETNINGAPGL